MSVHDTVAEVFIDVAKMQDRTLVPLTPTTPLFEIGLDSLSMAVIVTRLEGCLGFDPFSTEDDVEIPETFGDFVALYDRAMA